MQIVFLLYKGMTALDVVGPHEILSRLPGAVVKRAALRAGEIITDSGLILEAEEKLADIDQADILLVPGASNATSLQHTPGILNWIRLMHQKTTWTTSVCTGSLILGAAGLLSGVKATTHWAMFDRLQLWGAIPTMERIVESGKIITAAGVTAGIDMALLLAAKVAGESFAEACQLGLEYDPQPPFDVGSPDKARPEVREIFLKTIKDRLEKK